MDNYNTNDGMITMILEKLANHCCLDGRILHMRCCAHILNLIVKNGLSTIENAIDNIGDSVSYWSTSPSRVEKFMDIAHHLKLSCTKKLSLDFKTRWNSIYLMIVTAIEYKEVEDFL